MNKAREFDDILNECLERILLNGETVEQCLASYPEQAAELEPLLRTAAAAGRAATIKPRPEFRDRARHQFQAAIREMEEKKARGFFGFGWQPRWATALIVALVVLMTGSGTVAAAGNSMPDEPLYQVKLATERVRLAFTPSSLGKAELYVKLADKRVEEIAKMAEKGKSQQVERVAHRLNGHLVAMASLTAPQKPEAAMLQVPAPAQAPRAVEKEAEVAEAPQEAEEEAPQPAMREAPKPAMRKAPKAVQKETPQRPETAVRGRGGGAEEEDVASADRHTRLRMTLSRHAVENPEMLREILEQVPESARPALLRAIALSDEAYKQALEALEGAAGE